MHFTFRVLRNVILSKCYTYESVMLKHQKASVIPSNFVRFAESYFIYKEKMGKILSVRPSANNFMFFL